MRSANSVRSSSWDLARLRLFVHVAHEGSLTKAASVAGIPQPAISRQMTKFEQECGGRLFLRTGRGVVLSPLGLRILPRVQALLQDASNLADEVQQGAVVTTGDVRIGALPSLAMILAVPLFRQLHRRSPGIHLHVFEGSAGQIEQWLVSGFIDIGVPYRYGRGQADVEHLADVASYLVGPPRDRLTNRKTIKFAQLDRLPLVLPSEPSSLRLLLAQLAQKEGIQLNVVLDADSGQIQKALAARGDAYTVLPPHAFSSELKDGLVQAALIVDPGIDRSIVMELTTARPITKATREVANTIRQLMLPPGGCIASLE